ncbi:MAG: hypothetical protein WA958_20245 [Tunicatimonas sp.]
MDCQKFIALPSEQQLDYIYHHCRLVDFSIVPERTTRYGVCLYHDGSLFIEVRFDSLQGERVKEINACYDLEKLAHWYDAVDLSSVLPLASER